jgi:hypothetical protein
MVRLMVGLCILKHLGNMSDEVLVQNWVQNPYAQLFCGEIEFQWKLPCDPTDLICFRKRIAEKGFEKILASSIVIHGDNAFEKKTSTALHTIAAEYKKRGYQVTGMAPSASACESLADGAKLESVVTVASHILKPVQKETPNEK